MLHGHATRSGPRWHRRGATDSPHPCRRMAVAWSATPSDSLARTLVARNGGCEEAGHQEPKHGHQKGAHLAGPECDPENCDKQWCHKFPGQLPYPPGGYQKRGPFFGSRRCRGAWLTATTGTRKRAKSSKHCGQRQPVAKTGGGAAGSCVGALASHATWPPSLSGAELPRTELLYTAPRRGQPRHASLQPETATGSVSGPCQSHAL